MWPWTWQVREPSCTWTGIWLHPIHPGGVTAKCLFTHSTFKGTRVNQQHESKWMMVLSASIGWSSEELLGQEKDFETLLDRTGDTNCDQLVEQHVGLEGASFKCFQSYLVDWWILLLCSPISFWGYSGVHGGPTPPFTWLAPLFIYFNKVSRPFGRVPGPELATSAPLSFLRSVLIG